MKHNILAGNWKMNLDLAEANQLLDDLIAGEKKFNKDTELIICPPAIYLSSFSEKLEKHPWISLGAQNCHFEKNGAHTGEISASQLKSINVKYCLVGHSERRDNFNEGYDLLLKKVKALLAADITPIFCCGEQLQVRESNVFKEFVIKQIEDSLFGLDGKDISKIIIAYEPIWAIGTGKTASAEEAQEIHDLIRQRTAAQYDDQIAKNLRILYGGSCKPSNAKELFSQKDINGGLIGGASLKADDFIELSNSF